MKKAMSLVLLLPLAWAAPAWADDKDDDAGKKDRTDLRERFRERMKTFDKNEDGKLDEDERRAMFEEMRKRFGHHFRGHHGRAHHGPARRPGDHARANRDSARN